jgi:tRNA modification GTPase
VQWVIEQFTSHGCAEERTPRPSGEGFACARAAELLPHAPTLRTASILLDQAHGAFANEVRHILHLLATDGMSAKEPLRRLCRRGYSVGSHLLKPWKVVVTGPPNVGKSSLVNALAGYQRAVVSEVAGTTRDAVSVRTAFDGWPVELIDTAGLREGAGLEAEGIDLARRAQAEADLLLWVLDVSEPEPVRPNLRELGATLPPWCVVQLVANKCDRERRWNPESVSESENLRGALPVSAATEQGIAELAEVVVGYLAPECPPGAAVPYNDRLVNLVCKAAGHWTSGEWPQAAACLREALTEAE